MIICSGNEEVFDFATSVGVGMVQSAINLTKICLIQKPQRLVFIGSAGSYGGYQIFDLVHCSNASNIELSFLNDDSYTPIDNIISDSNNPKNIVNSSNYITTNEALGKKFLALNIELENMEFYSVLSVAKEFEIPAVGAFVVSNYCDKNAHKEYQQNRQKVVKLLEDFARAKIISRSSDD